METNKADSGKTESGKTETVEAATNKARKPRRRRAVIDRIEDGKWAVLLVGYKEVEKVVPVEQLPAEARAGSWLKVRLQDDGVTDMIVDPAATQAARGRVESKMERLRGRQSRLQPLSSSEPPDASNRLQNSPPSQPPSAGE